MQKRRLFPLTGFVLGAACALIQGVTGSDILITLLKPFTSFGNLLRAWSLSGARGNALAWTVLIVLSLLPIIYILLARRKRRQPSDWLFLLFGAVVFAGGFLLANPTLYVHPMLTEALSVSPELLTGGPVFMMLSALLLAVVTRWSGGLMRYQKQDQRLIFWTQALLIGSMTLIAFSAAFSFTEAVQAAWSAAGSSAYDWSDFASAPAGGAELTSEDVLLQSLTASSGAIPDSNALISLYLTVLLLIPDLFSLRTLDAALSLVSSMGRGFFSDETDDCASRLAESARYTLIAAVGCMTATNISTVALAQWIANWNMSFSLPLDDMLISCGAMLLARLLGAACRVKRDNDLMI